MSFEDVVEGLKRIAQLGFHYVEVEAYGRTGANDLYQHREDLREWLNRLELRAPVFSYADYTLVHTDFRNEARFALERFQEKALPTASALDVEMIVINSFTPSGVFYTDPERDPTDPTYYRWPPYSDEDLRTSRLQLSDNFSMKAAWEALVAGCKIAAELSRRHGFPLALRARRRELCETCADLINLCNDVNFGNFFVAMDTALCNCGEEYLYAVKKLVEVPRRSGRVLSIYAADNDGHSFQRRAPRDGVGQRGIDWNQFARVLRQPLFCDGKPFRGPFVLELGGIDLEDIDRCLVTAAHRVQSLLTTHGIPWLI